jgi:hypothetical protein
LLPINRALIPDADGNGSGLPVIAESLFPPGQL